MERLVNGYLDFARGEGTETPVETDIALLIEDVAAAARRDGTPLAVAAAAARLVMPVRPNALRRCLGNLIANARRYGRHVWLSSVPRRTGSISWSTMTGPASRRRTASACSGRSSGSTRRAIRRPAASGSA